MESQQFIELIATLKARGSALAAAIAAASAPLPYQQYTFDYTDLNALGAVASGTIPAFVLPARHIVTEAYLYIRQMFSDFPAPPGLITLTAKLCYAGYPPLPPVPPPPVLVPPMTIGNSANILLNTQLWAIQILRNKGTINLGVDSLSVAPQNMLLNIVAVGQTLDLVTTGMATIFWKTEEIA